MSSTYEQTRQERIKENRERMQRLGLFDLSSQLGSLSSRKKPASSVGRNRRNTIATSFSAPHCPSPLRRSSRLQNVTPVSYSEALVTKKKLGILRGKVVKAVKLEVGAKPEVYTEEHEKLLGNTDRTWTLFVDGCGSDGKRIYDPVKGKTCHQCRQKTLGYRTHCSKCHMVQGQFCGDCLYMRYGEHVLEALENEKWICPVCRGICNCSLCRQAKGWPPTGPMYRKISSLGYKSVAHYLIQTRRAQNDATIHQFSAKRSLPFPDTEASLKKSTDLIAKESNILKPQPHESKDEEKISASGDAAAHGQRNRSFQFSPKKMKVTNLVLEVNEGHGIHKCASQGTVQNELTRKEEKQMVEEGTSVDDSLTKQWPLPSTEPSPENLEISEVNHELNGQLGLENDVEHTNEEENVAKRCGQYLGVKPASIVGPSPDSIAARLKQRRRKNGGNNVVELAGSKGERADAKQLVDGILFDEEAKIQTGMLQVKDENHAGNNITPLKNSSMLKGKDKQANEPNMDSIGGRLRQRRRMVKCKGV